MTDRFTPNQVETLFNIVSGQIHTLRAIDSLEKRGLVLIERGPPLATDRFKMPTLRYFLTPAGRDAFIAFLEKSHREKMKALNAEHAQLIQSVKCNTRDPA